MHTLMMQYFELCNDIKLLKDNTVSHLQLFLTSDIQYITFECGFSYCGFPPFPLLFLRRFTHFTVLYSRGEAAALVSIQTRVSFREIKAQNLKLLYI